MAHAAHARCAGTTTQAKGFSLLGHKRWTLQRPRIKHGGLAGPDAPKDGCLPAASRAGGLLPQTVPIPRVPPLGPPGHCALCDHVLGEGTVRPKPHCIQIFPRMAGRKENVAGDESK